MFRMPQAPPLRKELESLQDEVDALLEGALELDEEDDGRKQQQQAEALMAGARVRSGLKLASSGAHTAVSSGAYTAKLVGSGAHTALSQASIGAHSALSHAKAARVPHGGARASGVADANSTSASMCVAAAAPRKGPPPKAKATPRHAHEGSDGGLFSHLNGVVNTVNPLALALGPVQRHAGVALQFVRAARRAVSWEDRRLTLWLYLTLLASSVLLATVFSLVPWAIVLTVAARVGAFAITGPQMYFVGNHFEGVWARQVRRAEAPHLCTCPISLLCSRLPCSKSRVAHRRWRRASMRVRTRPHATRSSSATRRR